MCELLAESASAKQLVVKAGGPLRFGPQFQVRTSKTKDLYKGGSIPTTQMKAHSHHL